MIEGCERGVTPATQTWTITTAGLSRELTPNSKCCFVGVQGHLNLIDSAKQLGLSFTQERMAHCQLQHTNDDTQAYPRSDFLCSVLHLGKQIYQIRYFLALSDRQTGAREAAGRGRGGGHHSASTRGGGL